MLFVSGVYQLQQPLAINNMTYKEDYSNRLLYYMYAFMPVTTIQ